MGHYLNAAVPPAPEADASTHTPRPPRRNPSPGKPRTHRPRSRPGRSIATSMTAAPPCSTKARPASHAGQAFLFSLMLKCSHIRLRLFIKQLRRRYLVMATFLFPTVPPGRVSPPISPTAAVLLEDVLKTCSISFIGIVMQFHVGISAVECYSICPYYAGKTQCKPWHSTAQDGTPWCQMQRDSTLFQMAGTIPVHQCCIPLHRRTHSALLQNGLPHGLMQAHRERHTPTSRKRGALLEQYNPLSEHGNR